MRPRIITTNDGSHSLYHPEFEEQYHSVHGAIQESMHIYIINGFLKIQKNEIQVFEMGFGTGLNALLTMLQSEESKKNVKYISLEKYPLDKSITDSLNYPLFLRAGASGIFQQIHDAPWNTETSVNDFCLIKINGDLLDYNIPNNNDIVYFDAFSPDKVPEQWSDTIFKKIFDSMNTGGIFITYSAKGEVRRKLQSAGFKVKKLDGPPGKKHILQAIK